MNRQKCEELINAFSLPCVECVSVPMSYVSALVKKNPYKNFWHETLNVFRRYNSGVKRDTIQDEIENPVLLELMKNHKHFFTEFTSARCVKKLQKKAVSILQSLCGKHKISYQKHRSLLMKKRGYVMENTALELYSSTCKVMVQPVEQRIVYIRENDPKFHTNPENACIRLVGKADGEADGKILEVKTRYRGFRDFAFERIQLAIYVIAYDKPGVLVEFYENKLKIHQMPKAQAREIWDSVYHNFIEWRHFIQGFMV